jgi:hypothetical protein
VIRGFRVKLRRKSGPSDGRIQFLVALAKRSSKDSRCDSSSPRGITSEKWSFEKMVLRWSNPILVVLATEFRVIQGKIRALRVKSRCKSGRSKKWFSRRSNSIFLLP